MFEVGLHLGFEARLHVRVGSPIKAYGVWGDSKVGFLSRHYEAGLQARDGNFGFILGIRRSEIGLRIGTLEWGFSIRDSILALHINGM